MFRTYCVPSVSRLLDRTGELRHRPQKRYDDTDLIVSELMAWGYDSDRGQAALRRMNRIHGRFAISDEDFLYVLSTFIFEPTRWNERYGWRPFCEQEHPGYFHFWREAGCRMSIREIPETYEDFEGFNVAYERANLRFAETNHSVGSATRELFLSRFPGPLRPLVRQSLSALMDDPLLAASGFARPLPGMRKLVSVGMKLRARILSWVPARRHPYRRTEIRRRCYPRGYRVEELGPQEIG